MFVVSGDHKEFSETHNTEAEYYKKLKRFESFFLSGVRSLVLRVPADVLIVTVGCITSANFK